jgi:hypothetical protein
MIAAEMGSSLPLISKQPPFFELRGLRAFSTDTTKPPLGIRHALRLNGIVRTDFIIKLPQSSRNRSPIYIEQVVSNGKKIPRNRILIEAAIRTILDQPSSKGLVGDVVELSR